MNRKGQIFSLDFLLSIVLVVLAIGLVLQFIEMHEYSMKDEELRAELKAVGERAADLLVSSPDIVCELIYKEGGNEIFVGYLNNCLGIYKGNIPEGYAWGWWRNKGVKLIDKETLGIPNGYNCQITIEGIDFSNLGSNTNIVHYCNNSPPAGTGNIYAATRKIVAFWDNPGTDEGDSTVEKQKLEDCMNNGPDCEFYEGIITLKVWKA